MLALLTAWKVRGAPTEGQGLGSEDSLGLSPQYRWLDFPNRGVSPPPLPSLGSSHRFLRLVAPDGGEKEAPGCSYHNRAVGARGALDSPRNSHPSLNGERLEASRPVPCPRAELLPEQVRSSVSLKVTIVPCLEPTAVYNDPYTFTQP